MRRVAITGYGILSCLGNSNDEVRTSLQEGRSGIAYLPERKEMGFRSALAGRMTDPGDPDVPRRTLRSMGEAPRMGMHAATQALAHSGLPEDQLKSERTAMIIGHGGVAHDVYRQCFDFKEGLSLGGTALQRVMNDTVSANLSILLGTRGYSYTVSAACATGATAIGQAYHLIRHGLQDRALCGGFMENSWEYACQFDATKAFSVREDEPTKASRPFDRDRDGLVPSAGGSILVLEEMEAALARGATIRAELAGYSFGSDAADMTAPTGDGGARAIRQALEEASISPGEVDYVNAHATATLLGDVVEAKVIADVFGTRPYVSSTKSMTGHEGAAAGSNEAVYTLLMMEHGFVAPTLNLEHLDPECEGIRAVAGTAETADVRVATSNSFGFGGVNTCLVMRRV
jgi:3-oxoacyl-[acyl-carrier-protein] synthase-1